MRCFITRLSRIYIVDAGLSQATIRLTHFTLRTLGFQQSEIEVFTYI